jgi:hypothetical protein
MALAQSLRAKRVASLENPQLSGEVGIKIKYVCRFPMSYVIRIAVAPHLQRSSRPLLPKKARPQIVSGCYLMVVGAAPHFQNTVPINKTFSTIVEKIAGG